MNFTSTQIPYSKTNKFSEIVIDYISNNPLLEPFYSHSPNLIGIGKAIEARKDFTTDRSLLVKHLKEQYKSLNINLKVASNIDSLESDNVFTICTAHQPNIFTGHLYFIYKIVHAIKLADYLNEKFPSQKFVPVFYVGSEDADLEELGEVSINGKNYEWKTDQSGAVGRMKVDKSLLNIIDSIANQIEVLPFGKEIMQMVRSAYTLDELIERSTLKFVNDLFGEYGLVILLTDNSNLKKSFDPILKNELENKFSAEKVTETIKRFPEKYKIQTAGRDINLFYLLDNSRERIEAEGDSFVITNSDLKFTKDEMKQELNSHPERFSPNVVLRPVFQEWILPNVAFIGGGGELAYWLELKGVFDEAKVPMPVLVLRNSYMFLKKKHVERLEKMNFQPSDLFSGTQELINKLVSQLSENSLSLQPEIEELKSLYKKIEEKSGAIDSTLINHTNALLKKSEDKILSLQKKMMKHERRKHDNQVTQLSDLKNEVFPNGNLQERIDNLIPFYALYGSEFIKAVCHNALVLNSEFTILIEN
ncbi:MAG: bacillithiol biosynthesis cysteine-adding enzyme BshC [Ferruginibacter sp.]